VALRIAWLFGPKQVLAESASPYHPRISECRNLIIENAQDSTRLIMVILGRILLA